jgi:hypothetical protein
VIKKVVPALPQTPTVLLAVSGDEAMAMQIQTQLEAVIQRSGLPVATAADIPALAREMRMGESSVSWRSIKRMIPPGEAHILVIAKIRQTGSTTLQYYGRYQEMITAALSATAVDLENGVPVSSPVTASVQFTALNMGENLASAVTGAASGMGASIQSYWRNKVNAAGKN